MASHQLLWTPAGKACALSADEVQVWCVDLNALSSRAEAWTPVLSKDERHRAGQFKFPEGRDHYIIARAALRQLLGEALAVEPADLVFDYGERGKPQLGGDQAGAAHFNVSHSGGLALTAFTARCPLGVDLERIRPAKHGAEIADRFFTSRESASLAQLPEAVHTAAFFNLWTRKEAWLKATGAGIADSLKRVEVTFVPGEPARVLEVAGDPGEAARWTLVDLKPAVGFAAALAFPESGLNVICHRWVE